MPLGRNVASQPSEDGVEELPASVRREVEHLCHQLPRGEGVTVRLASCASPTELGHAVEQVSTWACRVGEAPDHIGGRGISHGAPPLLVPLDELVERWIGKCPRCDDFEEPDVAARSGRCLAGHAVDNPLPRRLIGR